jgi:hypothetical protein
VIIFSKRPQEAAQEQKEKGGPALSLQQEKGKSSRLYFLWLVVIIFILALGFTLYKLYQFSTWIYVGPMDWMTFGIAGAVVLITFISILRLSSPANIKGGSAQAGQRYLVVPANNMPASMPTPSEPFHHPVSAGPGVLPKNVPSVSSAKKGLDSGWIGFFAILAVLAVAIGLAVSVLNDASGTGSSSGAGDPCAEVRQKLESWSDCDSSNTQGDSVHCIVKARNASGCYTDQNGMRMCTDGVGDGFVPRVCVGPDQWR